MKTFADFEDWHKSKLNEVCNESLPDPNGVNTICRELGLLPLMFDMGGCYALRANGEIVSFLWEEERDLRLEKDPRILNIALFQGSKRYPEIATLIPARSDDAIECSYCDGTGIEKTTASLGFDNFVCHCGGLGWIPKNNAETTADAELFPKQQEENKPKAEKVDWRIHIPSVACAFGASILRDQGISPPLALLIAGSIAFLLGYWVPPKGKDNFWKYAVMVEYWVFGFTSAIYYLPVLLAHTMPAWFSSGFFTFLFLIIFYPLERVIGSEVKITNFRKWLVYSLGAAILVGLLKAFVFNSL